MREVSSPLLHMALSMPRAVALGSGVYHLNIRVPSDLAEKAKGTTVTLPVEGRATTVRIGDKVIVSLRTKDPAIAKLRFAEAEQALTHHWRAIRSGPVTLLHKQVVALAGEVYRRWVELYETSPETTSDRFAEDMRRMDADVEAWRFNPNDDAGEISQRSAEILARLARPNGPFLLAFELGRNINVFDVSATLACAEEVLFGSQVDRICAERSLIVDEATRRSLVREVSKAIRFAAQKHLRAMDGDYGPDANAARFPAFEAPKHTVESRPSKPHRIETAGRRGQVTAE